MTTKLDKPIVRELALEYEGRRVILGVLPAADRAGLPALERFEFRLKGTSSTKNVKRITVRELLRSLGWEIKVRVPKAASVTADPIGESPELQELERLVKLAGETS